MKEALKTFIEGNTTPRKKISLMEDGKNYKSLLIETLSELGFKLKALSDISVEQTHRIPAFYILESENMAYFGWIRWERFHFLEPKKVWTSEARDRGGDFEIVIFDEDPVQLYVDESKKMTSDGVGQVPYYP